MFVQNEEIRPVYILSNLNPWLRPESESSWKCVHEGFSLVCGVTCDGSIVIAFSGLFIAFSVKYIFYIDAGSVEKLRDWHRYF